MVIVDIGMPILNGIVTTQRLKESKPNIKIVVVSQHTDRSFLRAAFSAGADAYVTKQSSPNELREAVRRVLGGEVYVSPALVEARALAGLDPRIHAELIFGDHLTHRQREVLQLIAEGKSIKEMAHLLGVSQKTIEFHKANLMDLVGLRTTAELTRYALQHGLAGPLSPEVGGVRARQIIVNTR